ncbi:hypothetical protein [Paenarthrobacter histidinolovorans]|uniref:Uncharacterized protein n=1 Tax=Paenarthrobacter histidinolovorans TaxID=43664 RepID=A0ABW8N7I8_9MICC
MEHIPNMRGDEKAERASKSSEPPVSLESGDQELARRAPILAGKLARLTPEQLAMIFPPENSVGPL